MDVNTHAQTHNLSLSHTHPNIHTNTHAHLNTHTHTHTPYRVDVSLQQASLETVSWAVSLLLCPRYLCTMNSLADGLLIWLWLSDGKYFIWQYFNLQNKFLVLMKGNHVETGQTVISTWHTCFITNSTLPVDSPAGIGQRNVQQKYNCARANHSR